MQEKLKTKQHEQPETSSRIQSLRGITVQGPGAAPGLNLPIWDNDLFDNTDTTTAATTATTTAATTAATSTTQQQLAQKLKTMQEKLLMGEQWMDKAAEGVNFNNNMHSNMQDPVEAGREIMA